MRKQLKYLSAALIFFTFSSGAVCAQGSKLAELFSSVNVVKGAPFSAEAVSESVQNLADGNKITRKTVTRLYRDGEGRFRREGMPNPNVGDGSLMGLEEAVFIYDPATQTRFLLNPKLKTAERIGVLASVTVNADRGTLSAMEKKRIELEAIERARRQNQPPAAGAGAAPRPGAPKEESLGTRQIEGVEAEGTRLTVTIPAGLIGNERPMDVVYERWYSKELQMIVYSRNSDPRFGEQTYRLTNISRREPDRALFSPPADYKVQGAPPPPPPPAKTRKP